VINVETLAGLALVLISVGLMFVFALPQQKRSNRIFRVIPAFQNLRRALGLAVENGKRLHVSIGKSSLLQPNNASALVGLTTLERVAEMSIVSDRPPIATSGDPGLAILSQDTLRAAYRTNNALDQYTPDRGRLAGPTPISYVLGTLPVVHDEQVSAHVLVGNFGPEVALITEAIERENAFSLAASDSLPAQAVMFATARETLIGEEAFAVPAYLQAGPMHTASLRAEDVLRWVLVGFMLVGIVLALMGVKIL